MLSQLRDLGWNDLHGIEPDPEAAEFARATGANVQCGTVEDVLPRYPDAHFDAIIASMVVEHVADPFEVARGIARKLKPGGELLVSTVTRDSAQAAIFGKFWAGFDFPRHMVYFRNADIVSMLADDFEGVEWFNQIAPIDWIRSSTWRGRPIDLVLARAGRSGWLIPSVVVAVAGRSTRISIRSRRKASS
jgi:SAM-dependent methyltransferase